MDCSNTFNSDCIGDSSDSSSETVKIVSCGLGRFTDWLSLSSDWVSFTASATIIEMTMSVFEFSEPGSDRNRGTHQGLHGTYQTSHGRPHCPILISLLLSQILGLTTVNSSELEVEATLPLPTALDDWSALTQWQLLSVTLLVSWSTWWYIGPRLP